MTAYPELIRYQYQNRISSDNGILGNWLYFLTPDNYFVSLDVATGKERWHHEIANMKREYFSTNAPMIIGKQVKAIATLGTSRPPVLAMLVFHAVCQPLPEIFGCAPASFAGTV